MQQKRWGQAGLIAILLLVLILSGFQPGSVAASEYAQSTIFFTPQLTPVELTATLQPNSPLQLNMTPGSPVPQISPVPHPPGVIVEPPEKIKGGTEDFGYEFVDGSEPPTWMLYWGDDVFFFTPDDPAYGSLLDAYRDAVDDYSNARTDIDNKIADMNLEWRALIWEGGGFIAGAVTAGVSCSSIVGTFWAAGGTAWTCVGGVAGSVTAFGLGVNSIKKLIESDNQLSEHAVTATTALQDAEEFFLQLQAHSQNMEGEQP